MKAQDLRIGNLVQLYRKPEDKEKTFHAISQIGENTVVLEDGFIVNVDTGIEPIPLTEEWLLKLGFEETNTMFKKSIIHFYHRNDGKFEACIGNQVLMIINSVSQLQNLYFALTGEELTINN